jgi:hypothetical protein
MTIPHEVGHFIYHHAHKTKEAKTFAELTEIFIWQQRQSNSQAKLYDHWYEELFADVYGCFIAGPLSAMGMQALLAASSERSLSEDDGEHPVPLLRPFLISEILRILTQKDPARFNFQTVPQKLDENWEKILQLRGNLSVTMPVAAQTFSIVQPDGQLDQATIAQVLDAVRPIITLYVDQLMANLNPHPWESNDKNILSPAIPWSQADHTDLKEYDKEMENLTNLAYAQQKLPQHTLSHTKKPSFKHLKADNFPQLMTDLVKELDDPDRAEQQLLDYLAKWGDSGPGGFGRHP